MSEFSRYLGAISGMSKKSKRARKVQSEPAGQLEAALGHPLRAWCLARLNETNASAAELAKESAEPRNVVNYHFKMLEQLGCIELVEERPVRGTPAKIYRATTRVILEQEDWEGLGIVPRTGISVKALGETFERAQQALEAGTFDKRLDRVIANYKLNLDEQGWAEAVEILCEAHHRLEQVEPESINRTPCPSQRSRFRFSLLGYEAPGH